MAVGGDYAVVAYATEQVVTSHHWLSSREVQEGIAMGEMVPGTIMIVTQFLGSVAAFRDPGQLPPLVAGLFGGLLATWMTMCPCFLWIMLIAPFLEGLRHNAFLNSTMQAVTAAAVGMILNLSVWFGLRTMFGHIERFHFSYFRFDFPVFSHRRSLGAGAVSMRCAGRVPLQDRHRGDVDRIVGSRRRAVHARSRRLMVPSPRSTQPSADY